MPTLSLKTGDMPLIIEQCKKSGLLRNQAAYVLATVIHETAGTAKPIKETVMAHHQDKNPSDAVVINRLNVAFAKGQLGSVKTPYWRDGWFGRGYVQITHKANYDKLGVTKDTALQPAPAAKAMIDGMVKGLFTGKKLSDYITLNTSGFVGARRIINGTDKAELIAGYAKEYDALLKQSGYGEDATSTKEMTKEGIIVAAGVSVVAGLWYALSFIPCKLLGVLCG